jgi:hypothetical protein
LYGYVWSSPINFTDPSGLSALSDAFRAWSKTFPSPSGYWEAVQAYKEAHAASEKVDPGAMTPGESQYMGPGDAIRHCVLACSLTQRLGSEDASSILDGHEANESRPDMMDEYNNQMGCFIGENSPVGSCESACFTNFDSLMTHREDDGTFITQPRPIGE